MKVHNKLVRDKIPEIIEEAAKNLEEMADILEVIQSICIARGYTLNQLKEKRKKKAEKSRGFRDKIYLEYVE